MSVIKVLFICHGNICRSPMAEMILKDMVRKQHREQDFLIDSAATSNEEIGNGIHPGTRRKLAEVGIACETHRARRLTKYDYNQYDYLIGMDRYNIQNIKQICGADPENKIRLMLHNTGMEVADPWYTGNFDQTYEDISRGCKELLQEIQISNIKRTIQSK